jgi:ElaB/YqjD/DUF883 family membrane-anchored ribosome-binding protein
MTQEPAMQSNDKATVLARDMRNVVSEVETLLRDANSAGHGAMSDLRSRVGQAMDMARARIDRMDTGVRTGARRAATITDDYVHASPWQAVGVGLLVGLAAGALLLRRW